ncbi:hypothetical protein PHYBLDRAFT_161308 [Phycomyces blakesleeanus NRRL 1555(-)]|uniref:Uncharacterized protein n=1 Tax=Phycomyces blakesleeanus (strain ATCC 8743b / DSM 1359 / FGSC 10004 / NBRC 33097 / NRRL 1555) TaxID=763407 RepID=A0A167R228_PHYB8|nr:hypothetical protein PHYBLDRAFT_161308 [Phycomyces blakesleeanus NRRL 1555(-)]OAD80669.1 hypothetical protein PHYBLDRAFT_161308 [Phycomyces blakesleeanus NRRL 1555(-)]|eukprot:XP_018298709.1 hypothetical protein PHYBLDRAFT_161308 [Phycomyces blakesleeanus NRRL 1555(-)]
MAIQRCPFASRFIEAYIHSLLWKLKPELILLADVMINNNNKTVPKKLGCNMNIAFNMPPSMEHRFCNCVFRQDSFKKGYLKTLPAEKDYASTIQEGEITYRESINEVSEHGTRRITRITQKAVYCCKIIFIVILTHEFQLNFLIRIVNSYAVIGKRTNVHQFIPRMFVVSLKPKNTISVHWTKITGGAVNMKVYVNVTVNTDIQRVQNKFQQGVDDHLGL